MKKIYFYVLTLLVCFVYGCTSSYFNQNSGNSSVKKLKMEAEI